MAENSLARGMRIPPSPPVNSPHPPLSGSAKTSENNASGLPECASVEACIPQCSPRSSPPGKSIRAPSALAQGARTGGFATSGISDSEREKAEEGSSEKFRNFQIMRTLKVARFASSGRASPCHEVPAKRTKAGKSKPAGRRRTGFGEMRSRGFAASP
jgi:hypothetical protein